MEIGGIVAVIVGGALVGLADWYFGAVLFHDKYMAYPEVWRPRETNRHAIIAAQGLAVVSAIGFVVLAARLHLTDFSEAFTLAFWIWIIGPLPILLTNAAFIKVHPFVVAGNTAGWFVKLAALAFVTATFL
jgi:hypothetical protein